MPLTPDIKRTSYKALQLKFNTLLNETDKQLLSLINDIAAEDNIALNRQGNETLDKLIQLIKSSKSENNEDLAGTAAMIYDLIAEFMASQSAMARSKHLAQGHFDLAPLHLRALRDQMQDHDMSLSMPHSTNNISVLAVLNRLDPSSAFAIQDVLASDIFNEEINHIIIPIGPGHWRGMYLTKLSEAANGVLYDLELFDPYGPSGASAIDNYTLNLLQQCGIPRELIRLRHTGPAHPQGDAYSCGDFTNAHSHKKMKEFGSHHYNENLVNTLENLGNGDDILRFTTREETQKLKEGIVVTHNKNAEPAAVHNDSIATGPASKRGLAKSSDRVDTKAAEQTKQSAQLSSKTRFGIEMKSVTGGAVLGAVVGGLIGFFGLPVLGAPIGMALGAALGALVSLAVVGLTRLFSVTASMATTSQSNTATSEGEQTDSPSNTYDNDSQQELGVEPIISPPLFSRELTKTRHDEQDKVENAPTQGPSFR